MENGVYVPMSMCTTQLSEYRKYKIKILFCFAIKLLSFTFSQGLLQVDVCPTGHDQTEQLQRGGVEVGGAHERVQDTPGHGNTAGEW